jgi:hypothetical protein
MWLGGIRPRRQLIHILVRIKISGRALKQLRQGSLILFVVVIHHGYIGKYDVSTILRRAGTCHCDRRWSDKDRTVGQHRATHSKVKTTRSPFGSGFLVTLTLQSIMDMIPSPNCRNQINILASRIPNLSPSHERQPDFHHFMRLRHGSYQSRLTLMA